MLKVKSMYNVCKIAYFYFFEKLYLLIELVGIRGDKQIEAYNKIEKLSLIE